MLFTEFMEVYVRKAHHAIDGGVRSTFDIVRCEVFEEGRGQGIFTAWLDYAEALLAGRFECIYLENILNERLLPFYTKRGYILIPDVTGYGGAFPCMYKLC
jgi:GNAT superfamily N-acetyltransferase